MSGEEGGGPVAADEAAADADAPPPVGDAAEAAEVQQRSSAADDAATQPALCIQTFARCRAARVMCAAKRRQPGGPGAPSSALLEDREGRQQKPSTAPASASAVAVARTVRGRAWRVHRAMELHRRLNRDFPQEMTEEEVCWAEAAVGSDRAELYRLCLDAEREDEALRQRRARRLGDTQDEDAARRVAIVRRLRRRDGAAQAIHARTLEDGELRRTQKAAAWRRTLDDGFLERRRREDEKVAAIVQRRRHLRALAAEEAAAAAAAEADAPPALAGGGGGSGCPVAATTLQRVEQCRERRETLHAAADEAVRARAEARRGAQAERAGRLRRHVVEEQNGTGGSVGAGAVVVSAPAAVAEVTAAAAAAAAASAEAHAEVAARAAAQERRRRQRVARAREGRAACCAAAARLREARRLHAEQLRADAAAEADARGAARVRAREETAAAAAAATAASASSRGGTAPSSETLVRRIETAKAKRVLLDDMRAHDQKMSQLYKLGMVRPQRTPRAVATA